MEEHIKQVRNSFFANVKHFEQILDSVNDGVYVTDWERRIVYWNKAAQRITGFSREKVVGKYCHESVMQHKDEVGNSLCDTDLCPLHRAIQTGQSSSRPLRVVAQKADTDSFVSAVSVAPVRDGNGNVIGGVEVFRDITEDLELERVKTEFFSTITHELKTPLTSIIGYLDLILEGDTGEINREQDEFLSISLKQAERLLNMISDILEIQKMKGGDLPLNSEHIDLVVLTSELLTLQEPLLREKGLTLNFHHPKTAPYLGDRRKLEKILENLISNAIKYTRKGGVTVTIKENEQSYIFSVADTGVGLSPEEQEKVFERFYRSDNSLTRDTGGTGLGLYIVKTMLEKMGGEIFLVSEPDKGSKFTVNLPKI